MTSNSFTSPTPIPPSLLPQFEGVCHEFATAWEKNESPDIEAFANRVESSEASRYLFGVLIALEVRLRIASGENPAPDDYIKRFPKFEKEVQFAFQESNTSVVGNGSDATQTGVGDVSLDGSLYLPSLKPADESGKDNAPTIDDKAPIEWDDIPKRLGRYEIKEAIGQGGFGIVCLAQDTTLGRPVALKFAKHGSFESREHLSAFIREARIVARLQHPSIVTVFDIKRFGDLLCIVQQYVAGQDLRKELKAGLPSFRRAAELCQAIAEGVGFAHQHGFFHRDIKPANILIDENGRPQIADFGLAIHESAQRRRRGERTGTPRYMPPELVLGETHRIDGRSDIWSLGVVMYEMLTGNRAFNGSSLEEIFDEIQHRNPIPPRQINPAIPAELERICLKCLSKRVVDRYSSASDLADDLGHWLFSNGAVDLPENDTQTVTAARNNEGENSPPSKKESVTFGALDQVKIVPRGLKAFDAHDADFFVHLLPGPRDRDGLPDSIRFWKNRVERDAVDDNDGIGLIYGPSGCGKSSFVKAGLIPNLSNRIIPVYVEATRSGTESRLKAAIRRVIPEIPEDLSLASIFDMLRDGSWMRRGRKLLIVIDQFEQWLHNHNPSELSELARAIRHADGLRIECILMVRDDFWLATSRFMRTVEVDLLEGRNATLIDLFDKQHARKVLCEFGQAYNALPEQLADLTKAQTRFIKEVIDGIAEQEKVICVRLSTFAEMFKDKPWTATELAKVGGPQGVGIKFLEDTFGSKLASPEHRLYEPAARKLLGALLPESGTDIRGNMLSASQLMKIVGYENRNKDFDNLTRILDQELRLITLTDPLGTLQVDTIYTSGSAAAQIEVAHFQLTHDFLVTPLREWLNLKQQSTMRGRAQLRLSKRCAMWSQQPSNEYLPGIVETANIFSLTKASQWSEQESRMMRQAGWTHGIRLALATIFLTLTGWFMGTLYSEQQASNLVARLIEAETGDVPQIIETIKDSPRAANLVENEIQKLNEASDPKKRLHLQLARYFCDGVARDQVVDALLAADPLETTSIVQLLARDKDSLGEAFWERVKDANEPTAVRVRLASALAFWFPDDPQWNEVNGAVLASVLDQVPFEIAEWGKNLKSAGNSLYPSVAEFIAVDRGDPKTLISLAQMFSQKQTLDRYIEVKDESTRSGKSTFYDRWRDSANDHAADGRLLSEQEKLDREESRLNYVKYSREVANLVAAQLVLADERDSLWSKLRCNQLTLRSNLIERLVETGIDPQKILDQIKVEKDPEIKSGLLLALGNFVRKDPQFGKRILDQVAKIYQEDPSSQVHSAAEWLLRLIEPSKSNFEIMSLLDGSKQQLQWRRTGHDITLIRVNAPGRVTLVDNRDPENLRRPIEVNLERDLYVGSTEISIGQFRQFAEEGGITETRLQEIARRFSDDHPAIYIRWIEAAKFCNWLSAKEGIKESEFCYSEDGDFMKLVDDWESKKGFRLPTEFEWQVACQSECLTTWNCGSDEALLREYAWYEINTSATGDREVRRCGLLKPNRWGLFDMHGNAGEQTNTIQKLDNDSKNQRYIRKSGLPFSQAKELTSAYAFSLGLVDLQEYVGFRVVRLAD